MSINPLDPGGGVPPSGGIPPRKPPRPPTNVAAAGGAGGSGPISDKDKETLIAAATIRDSVKALFQDQSAFKTPYAARELIRLQSLLGGGGGNQLDVVK